MCQIEEENLFTIDQKFLVLYFLKGHQLSLYHQVGQIIFQSI